MAGYHGKGNTNALKTGANFWLKHRRLPEGPKFKTIGRFADSMREKLIQSLGGRERLSAQEQILIDNTLVSQVCVMLLASDIKEGGAFDSTGQVRPALKTLASYLNTTRLNLQVLGISEKGEEILDLPAHLTEHYSAQKESEGEGSTE